MQSSQWYFIILFHNFSHTTYTANDSDWLKLPSCFLWFAGHSYPSPSLLFINKYLQDPDYQTCTQSTVVPSETCCLAGSTRLIFLTNEKTSFYVEFNFQYSDWLFLEICETLETAFAKAWMRICICGGGFLNVYFHYYPQTYSCRK